MTRAELLKRLQDMQASGQDMTLPVIVRVNRKVEDKRTRSGYRLEQLFASVEYACNSSLSFSGSHGDGIRSYGAKKIRQFKSGDTEPYYETAELTGYALTEFK
ncbi:MAG TPA: hypothetical protein VHK27_05460 [Gammaproteobacteria bacterium]|nr:hypothetical protein [Gammaproteobacteria bacterium]